MRIGFLLMPTDSWNETIRTARWGADLGLDRLWVYDHRSWQIQRAGTGSKCHAARLAGNRIYSV